MRSPMVRNRLISSWLILGLILLATMALNVVVNVRANAEILKAKASYEEAAIRLEHLRKGDLDPLKSATFVVEAQHGSNNQENRLSSRLLILLAYCAVVFGLSFCFVTAGMRSQVKGHLLRALRSLAEEAPVDVSGAALKVTREPDPEALTRLALLMFFGVALSGGFLFAATKHFNAVQYSERSENLRHEISRLSENLARKPKPTLSSDARADDEIVIPLEYAPVTSQVTPPSESSSFWSAGLRPFSDSKSILALAALLGGGLGVWRELFRVRTISSGKGTPPKGSSRISY